MDPYNTAALYFSSTEHERTERLVEEALAKAKRIGHDVVVVQRGPERGKTMTEKKAASLGLVTRPLTADVLRSLIKAETSTKIQKSLKVASGTQKTRALVLDSSARESRASTSSSDFIMDVRDALRDCKVTGLEVVGTSIPRAQWPIEPTDLRVPLHFGFRPGPAMRAMGVEIIATETRQPTMPIVADDATVAGTHHIIQGELPLARNPITEIASITWNGTRALWIRTAARTGSHLATQARKWREMENTSEPELIGISMLPGMGGEDDVAWITPDAIVGCSAECYVRMGVTDMLPEEPVFAESRGNNAVLTASTTTSEEYDLAETPEVVEMDPSETTSSPFDIVIVDASLHDMLFGSTPLTLLPDGTTMDIPKITSTMMGGMPVGYLVSAPIPGPAEALDLLTTSIARDVGLFGMNYAASHNDEGHLTMRASWSQRGLAGNKLLRSTDSVWGTGLACPIFRLHADGIASRIGMRRTVLFKDSSSRTPTTNITKTFIEYTSPVTLAIPSAECASLRVRKDIADVTTLGTYMTEDIHTSIATSSIAVACPPTRSPTWVVIPGGVYTPLQLADQVRACIVGAFSELDVQCAVLPAQDADTERPVFAFRIKMSKTFALRFDLHPSTEGALDPSILGFRATKLTGRKVYDPPLLEESPPRVKSHHRISKGDGFLTPAPGQLFVRALGDLPRVGIDAEALPSIDSASVLARNVPGHAVALNTGVAHGMMGGEHIRLVNVSISVEDDPLDDEGAAYALEALRVDIVNLHNDELVAPITSLRDVLSEWSGDIGTFQTAYAQSLTTYELSNATLRARSNQLANAMCELTMTASGVGVILSTWGFVTEGSDEVRAALASIHSRHTTMLSTLITATKVRRTLLILAAGDFSEVSGLVVPVTDDVAPSITSSTIPFGHSPGRVTEQLPGDIGEWSAFGDVDMAFSASSAMQLPITLRFMGDVGEHTTYHMYEHLLELTPTQLLVRYTSSADIIPCPPSAIGIDFSSTLRNSISPLLVGLNRDNYFATTGRPICSERDILLDGPSVGIVSIVANPTRASTSHADIQESLAKGERVEPDDDSKGPIHLFSTASEALDANLEVRCAAMVPLHTDRHPKEHVLGSEERSVVTTGGPLNVERIRVTVRHTNGVLYPLHGREVLIRLLIHTIELNTDEDIEAGETGEDLDIDE